MGRRLLLTRGPEVAVVGLLAAIPLVVTGSYALGLLTLLAIYGILLVGLDVTVGWLGQVNLGHVAFLGLGAYAAGLVVTRFHGGLALALLASTATGLLFGVLLAFPALRLEGPQFALATLSFATLSTTALNELEGLTGGAQGLSLARPPVFGHAVSAPAFFWFCLALLVLVWLAMKNLLDSQWGRAFEALRDSPIATDAMGVGTYRHRVAAFALGSAMGGLAGGLYALNFQYLQPQTFTYDLMVVLLLGVVLGGRMSLWGAFAGACLVVLLPNLLSSRLLFQLFSGLGFLVAAVSGARGLLKKTLPPFQAIAPVVSMGLLVAGGLKVQNTEDWRKAIFALMLFSVVVGLPEGIMGFVSARLATLFRLEPPPLPPASGLDAVLPARDGKGEPLLELHGLRRRFGGVKAVDDVSMTVRQGTVHGLIGPNGSGKSTVANVISGLYAPSAGTMTLRGRKLPTGSLMKAARAGVARTFQNLQLFTGLTALENVMVALRGAYRVPMPLVLLGGARAEERRAEADALALLTLTGLEGEARTPAKDLSYGSQRLLEIARALARRPDLLVLDEPAAGLSHPDIRRLVAILRRIHERGVTMILIEHHLDVVSELCSTVTVLDEGRVLAEGTPEEIRRHPRVIEAYLGQAPETNGGEGGDGSNGSDGSEGSDGAAGGVTYGERTVPC